VRLVRGIFALKFTKGEKFFSSAKIVELSTPSTLVVNSTQC